jgi:predicted enzyme related to lactoylglutathione lyase
MTAPIVFFDIAGPDIEALRSFYSRLFGWDIGGDGRFAVSVVSPLGATLRKDPAEKMFYVGVPDVKAKLAEVSHHGGTVLAERFEVPGTVVLGILTDPAGNRIGLVEMDGDRVKVP